MEAESQSSYEPIMHGLISDAIFEIGGEDKLARYRKGKAQLEELIAEIQIHVGVLLKTDTVSFLFGAGASRDCGGVLIGTVPLDVERELVKKGINKNGAVFKWLRYFYLACKHASKDDVNIPTSRDEIIQRQKQLEEGNPVSLQVNYESVLSLLHRWRAAMPEEGGRLRLGVAPGTDLELESRDLDKCIRWVTQTLARCCRLPRQGRETGFEAYRKFVRKILTRPLNLKRVNLFTLNYDTLIEQAADSEGVVLIDGFVGTLKRVFRPECYDQDLYFPAETTEGRVHRHDRVIHLYKLHGSITWVMQNPGWDNPYGLVAKVDFPANN